MATGLEIGKLADRARVGEPAALREFVKLAKQEGWTGQPGGMLYRDGKFTGVRGWRELADHVYFGMVRFRRVETGPGA